MVNHTSDLPTFYHSIHFPDITKSHTNKLEAIFYISCPTFNGRGTTHTFSTLYLLLDHLITMDALRTGFSRICTFLLHHFRFHVSYWQLLNSTASSSLPWGVLSSLSLLACLCQVCFSEDIQSVKVMENRIRLWSPFFWDVALWHRVLGSNIL
jgi:hypothetical protein